MSGSLQLLPLPAFTREKGNLRCSFSRGGRPWLAELRIPPYQLPAATATSFRLLPVSSQRQCTQDLSFSGGLHLLVLPGPAAHSGLAILSLGSDSAHTLGRSAVYHRCTIVPSHQDIYSGLRIPVLAAAHLQASLCTPFNIFWSALLASTRVTPVARLSRLDSISLLGLPRPFLPLPVFCQGLSLGKHWPILPW